MMRRFPLLTGLIVIAAWFAAEVIMFNLVASWTGGLMAFLLFILKSVAGFVFVGQLLRRKLMTTTGIKVETITGAGITHASLKVLGAVLVVVPGFLAGIIGLALLTPSVRQILAGRVRKAQQDPRDIDLSSKDWQEIPDEPRKRIRRRAKQDEN
ncbi:MAG: FxsA family protein [Beijerinckiaceae bacterium]